MHPGSHASGRTTPLLRPDSRGPPPLPEPLPLRASPAEAAQAYRQLAAVRSEVDAWFERHVAGLYQMRQWANDNVDALRMRCDGSGSRPGTAAASRAPATPPPRGPSRTGEDDEAPWARSMPTTPPRSMMMHHADRMGGVGTPVGDTMVGSPQSHSKLALEDLLMSVGVGRDDRSGATPGFRSPGMLAGSPALNFDALVDNLTRGESVTPRHHHHDEAPAPRAAFARPPHMGSDGHGWAVSSGAHAGTSSSAPTPSAAAAGAHASGGGAHVVPMDSLMLRYGHSVTTRRRLEGYDEGRPVVSTSPGAEEEDAPPADIAMDAPCQLLVQFKRRRVAQVQSGFYVPPGRHVLVSGDRGDDLGLVLFTASRRPDGSHAVLGLANAALTRSVGVSHGTVQRVATPAEVHMLVTFGELEQRAVAVSTQRVEEHGLPMRILDAEYQFDRKKLTLFYESPHRLDFRELVKDLYKCFRARIWMEPAGDETVRAAGHGHANSSSNAALQQPPPSQPGFAAAAPTKSFGVSSSAATSGGGVGGFQLSHTSAPFVPASLQSGITMDPATLFGAPMEW